jgi:hypothetical protein
LLLAALLALVGCDRFDPVPVRPEPGPAPDAARVVRPAAEAVMRAAAACVERCELGMVNADGVFVLTDRCSASPESSERLRGSLDALDRALKEAPTAGAPAPAGLLALGREMAAAVRTAALSLEPVAGLSMQHASLATAFNALYPDARVAVDPPSLLASMKVTPDEASCQLERPTTGYNCKSALNTNFCWYGRNGATRPAACDLRGVTLPSPLVWKLANSAHPVLVLPTTKPK